MPTALQGLIESVQSKLASLQRLTQRNGFLLLLTRTALSFAANDLPNAAASVAYFALFSAFPLLLALIALFGFVYGTASAQDAVVSFLTEQIPVSRELISENVRAAIQARGVIGVVGIATLLWAATGVFSSMTAAVNRAWRFPNDRPFILQKLMEVGMALGVGVALGISLIATALLDALGQAVGLTPVLGLLRDTLLTRLAIGATALAFDYIIFLVVLTMLPTRRVRLSDVWLPALVGAILFELAKSLFGFYVSNFANYQLVFGSLSALVAFLFWAYISATILLFTTQLAAIYSEMRQAARGGDQRPGQPVPAERALIPVEAPGLAPGDAPSMQRRRFPALITALLAVAVFITSLLGLRRFMHGRLP